MPLTAAEQLRNLDYYFRVTREEPEKAVEILQLLSEDAFPGLYSETKSHSITELVINVTNKHRYHTEEMAEKTKEEERVFSILELLQYV